MIAFDGLQFNSPMERAAYIGGDAEARQKYRDERVAKPTPPMPAAPVDSEIVVGSIEQSNTDKAVAFLKRWPTPSIQLTAIYIDESTHEKGRIETRSFPPGDWPAVAEWIEARQGKANLYFTVNKSVPKNSKPCKTDIDEVVALHVDIDVPDGEAQEATAEALVEHVRAYKVEPSVIIRSGGGVQAFWLLQPADRIAIDGDVGKAEAAESFTRGLENDFSDVRGAKADHCHDVCRIMRLPFTLNLPDKKKIEKGRKPALATLVEFNDLRWPLATFKAAPSKELVSSGSVSRAKTPTVNVDWDEASAHYNLFPLDKLRSLGVEEHALMSLELGDNLSRLHAAHKRIGHRMTDGPYPSFSEPHLAIATSLLKAGLDVNEAAAVLADPQFPGNKYITRLKTEKDKRRAVERDLQRAAKDIVAQDKRAAATARGMPLWPGGTHDDAGLYPVPHLLNAIAAIEALGIAFRHDEFHDVVIAEHNGDSHVMRESIVPTLCDELEGAIRLAVAREWNWDCNKELLHDAITTMAHQNKFHPLRDYFDSLVWDETARLDGMVVSYFKAEDSPLNCALMRKQMIAAVRRIRQPGFKHDVMPVLVSDEGYCKSGAIECLAGSENFSDQTLLGREDRDVMQLTKGVLFFECAELAGLSRSEVEKTKAQLSRTEDRARLPYGRNVIHQPRQCVFMGTTNSRTFLESQTGNRRMPPIEIQSPIDLEALCADRDQLWAEAAHLEAQGESLVIDESLWPAARAKANEYRVADPWEDLLADIPKTIPALDPCATALEVIHHSEAPDWQLRVRSSVLLEHVLRIPPAQQNVASGKRLSTVMGLLGWQRSKSGTLRVNGQSVKGYWRQDPEAPAQREMPLQPGGPGQ